MNLKPPIFKRIITSCCHSVAAVAVLAMSATIAIAQVAPDALPPEAPKIEAPVSPFGFYALMTLFAALVMIGTFKNAKRNDVVELRKLSGPQQ